MLGILSRANCFQARQGVKMANNDQREEAACDRSMCCSCERIRLGLRLIFRELLGSTAE